MDFNFALADGEKIISIVNINHILQNKCHVSGGVGRRDEKANLQGIMNGSIDLLFVHNKKVKRQNFFIRCCRILFFTFIKVAQHFSVIVQPRTHLNGPDTGKGIVGWMAPF